MEDSMDQLMEYSLKGYCCSQILLQLGLDELGEENKTLVGTMSALCGGLHSGLLCGSLSGGACLISLFCKDERAVGKIQELVEWFEEEYETVNCKEIINGDLTVKVEKCPGIVLDTYEKVMELVE